MRSHHNRFVRVALTTALALSAPMAAAQTYSGSWYNPMQSGHGLSVDQLSPDSALLLWSTYDFAGNPMPLYAEVARDGDGYSGPAFAPFGPRFNDFDPADLEFEPWGHLAFNPQGCESATLAWQSPAFDGRSPFGSGSTALRSLAGNPGCAGSRSRGRLSGVAGTWYHPQLQGAGLNVQVLDDDSALIFWYTYDALGNPMPLYIEASIEGQRLEGHAWSPRGMRFGNFSRSDLAVAPFGTVSLEFSNCNHGVFAYQTPLGDGSFAVSRLTRLQGVDCDLPSAKPAGFGKRYEGRVETGTMGPGYEFVFVLANSRDELFVDILYSGLYRGAFVKRGGETWVELRRDHDYTNARFADVIAGPVQIDPITQRVVMTLRDTQGRDAEVVLRPPVQDGGQVPVGDLRRRLPGSYGEDGCYGFVCFTRIQIFADLSFEAYRHNRVVFHGKLGGLDDAEQSFDLEVRYAGAGSILDPHYPDRGRIVGSGRLEYGSPVQTGSPPPLKLLMLGTGPAGYIFERANRRSR